MRVFVTGASGWIGSAVVPELIAAGHRVVGLARSAGSAAALTAMGAEVRHGDLDDAESLRAGAQDSEGVVHLAFKHDFSAYAEAGHTERAVIETLGKALEGTDRPLLFASGTALLPSGRVVTENDAVTTDDPDAPRGGSERLALDYATRGVHSVALRFPPTVHGEGDGGFVPTLVDIARQKGVSGYIGDGTNRWPAVHRDDAARMVRLALEKAPAGSAVHATAEEGVATRDIAEVISRGLSVPLVPVASADAAEHFDWISRFFESDTPASNTATRKLLDWEPTGPTLLEDLEAGHYFRSP